jgi:hypothetical protein
MRALVSALMIAGMAQPAFAQSIYVDDPQGCAVIAADPDGGIDFASEGGLVLDASGYSSIEYNCSFEPPLLFDWSKAKVTTHVGYCEEPGPYIMPQLFSILLDPYSPGEVAIFLGEGEPLRFYACGK